MNAAREDKGANGEGIDEGTNGEGDEGTKDTKAILGHKDDKVTTAKKVNRAVMHSVTKAKKALWAPPELPVKTVKMVQTTAILTIN